MILRIGELTGPVVVGKYYLVPTVTGMWGYKVRAWPVIGARHNDTQCLKFEHQHYHIDGRFMAGDPDDAWLWRDVGSQPLMLGPDGKATDLPKPIWRRRKCRYLVSPHIAIVRPLAARSDRWQCHFDMWTGKQSRHDGRGWVCPHRSVPLADHPVVDGVVTCPLHLLRIEAATGRVLSPFEKAVPA